MIRTPALLPSAKSTDRSRLSHQSSSWICSVGKVEERVRVVLRGQITVVVLGSLAKLARSRLSSEMFDVSQRGRSIEQNRLGTVRTDRNDLKVVTVKNKNR